MQLRHRFSFGLLLISTVISSPAASRDNVLLVTIDDLNDWIGVLSDRGAPTVDGRLTGQGHPQASTPHLDRLAARGVLFTNAHCQAPMCRPSRTSFMSGLRPTTSGVYGNRLKYDVPEQLVPGQDVPWMTRRFADAGYDVFVTGKVLHGRNEPLGGTLSFATNQGPFPEHKLTVPAEITPASVWDIGVFPAREEDYTDLRIAEWMAGHIARPQKANDRPRFLALGFYNPHLPLFAPPRWFDAAPTKDQVVLGAERPGDLEDLPAITRRKMGRVLFKECAEWSMATEENLRTLTQAYLACTSAMDDALGRVIDALDESDLAENTWIVVFSDHGWHLGEKQHVAKQTLWTRSTRVPMIIVPPLRLADTPRGVRSDQPVELLDVYPTLVEALSLPAETTDAKLDGLSLLPWIADPDRPKERPAITTLYSHNHSIVDERYRYTRYADGSAELYDRQNDPHEFENLISLVADNPDLARVVAQLSQWIPADEAGPPDLLDDMVP